MHVYTDGSVQLNHGGTEMGQGLMTKVAQIVAEEFQIDLDRVKISATNTGKVPNTSATAASAGTDLNGAAALAAARTIKGRLIDFLAEHFKVTPEQCAFRRNEVQVGEQSMSFAELVRLAHYAPRAAVGDRLLRARPRSGTTAPAHAAGRSTTSPMAPPCPRSWSTRSPASTGCCAPICCTTSAARSTRRSTSGQIEGGFVQGMGWLTTEELCWNARGRAHHPRALHLQDPDRLATCRPTSACASGSRGSTASRWSDRSKAVGEPPLMLGISVFHAINDAIASLAGGRLSPALDAPATPERVLFAIEDLKRRAAIAEPAAAQAAE